MIADSKRVFGLWAIALTILTLLRLCTPLQAQVPRPGGPLAPGQREGILGGGGTVDPNGGNRILGGGGTIDPERAGRRAAVLSALTPTSELLIFLEPGANAARFARDHGLIVRYALRSDPNAYVFQAASPVRAFAAHTRMAQDRRVQGAYPNRITHIEKFSFTPNDPYFHKDTPAMGWPGQWHLYNGFTPGLDARVMGAWNRDITGQGVIIGIVDDCFETAHPDLAPNYVAADSWDFGQNDPNPNPVSLFDEHGIAVAGVAAARGGNGIGGSGAAPLAGLAGLRLDFNIQTVAAFVDATLYHSSGANTRIKVKNHSYGNTFDYSAEPAMSAALATSTAAGTIHCFSAGNGRDYFGADSNRKEPQNSPDAISVAALGSSGRFATYSSFGANVFVTAPSSSSRLLPNFEFEITTTDRTGEMGYNWGPDWGGYPDPFPDANYTSQFGGTSSASPLVAGVMALGKQAQPNLNTRFAKHLLVRTSTVVDAADSTLEGDGDGVTPGSAWRTNAAGFHFNQNYGFGLIDADAFTRMATQYSGVTPLQVANTGLINVGAALPDNNPTGIRRTFTINSATPLEELLLTLNVTHSFRGDVIAVLTSPRGTRARVMSNYWYYDPYDMERDIHWTFSVNTFWGENPQGQWTLEVKDVRADNVGTLDSFAVTARMGTLISGNSTSVTVTNVAGAIGQTVPLNATLRRTSDGAGLSEGTLTFKVNGTIVGTAVTNTAGVATRNYTIPDTLGLGGKPITVEFAGTTLYSASSGTGTLTVSKANTSVTVPTITGLNGQTVVLNATLRRTTDGVVLYGGTLTFKVDGITVGTAVTDGSGVARLNYTIPPTLGVGAHMITAMFAGTTLYNASSGTGTLTVD